MRNGLLRKDRKSEHNQQKAACRFAIYIHADPPFVFLVFTINKSRGRQNESEIDFHIRPGSYKPPDLRIKTPLHRTAQGVLRKIYILMLASFP